MFLPRGFYTRSSLHGVGGAGGPAHATVPAMALTRRQIWTRSGLAFACVTAVVLLSAITREEAHQLVTNPRATRRVSRQTPADYRMPSGMTR